MPPPHYTQDGAVTPSTYDTILFIKQPISDRHQERLVHGLGFGQVLFVERGIPENYRLQFKGDPVDVIVDATDIPIESGREISDHVSGTGGSRAILNGAVYTDKGYDGKQADLEKLRRRLSVPSYLQEMAAIAADAIYWANNKDSQYRRNGVPSHTKIDLSMKNI